MTNAPSGELLTTTAVGGRLHCTRWTVARLVARGELTPAQTTPLGYLFTADEVDRYLARRDATDGAA